jgi:glycosyltransferase involved in cell wall biosynthesis
VRFTGFLDQPLDELAKCDVLALPSHSRGEGRPLIVLDALAIGLPVVAVHGSPALEHMAAEFPGWIELAASAEPAALRAAAEVIVDRTAGMPDPMLPSWEDTARQFTRLALEER